MHLYVDHRHNHRLAHNHCILWHLPENNQVNAIKCSGCVPIGGYAYDRHRDACIVQCCSYYDLGVVPISFSVTMKNIGEWDVKIPIPASVLEKYFTVKQRG